MPLTIAYDAKRAFHNSRGLGNYSRDVIRLMAKYYPDAQIVLAGDPKVSIMQVPQNAKIVKPNALWRIAKSLWRSLGGMVTQLKQAKADIYHGLSQELPLGIFKTGIKTVVTFHDALFVRYPQNYPWLYRHVFTIKNKYALRKADHIIAITEQSKRDAIEFFGADPQKITVVYQGCNNQFREPENREKDDEIRKKYGLPNRYLLQVGAIEPNKNLQTILHAFAYLLNELKEDVLCDLKLVAVGRKSKYALTMSNLAQQLGIEDRLVFCHEVDFIDLPAFYRGSEMFLFPSFFEGFGIPIIEAQCCGTPVITSKGGCFGETAGEGALFVEPDNPQMMAEAIGSVLKNRDLRDNLIKKGKDNTLRFTDDIVARNIMAVYKKLL